MESVQVKQTKPKAKPAEANPLQTIAQIHERFLPLIGTEHNLPVSRNKGLPGQFLETLLGIPHSSNCLDCSDGELKLFPVKQLKNKKIVPKETIAVTMLNTDELIAHTFAESKCCKKMCKMLLVPYYRTGATIRFLTPKIIERTEFTAIYDILEADYNLIKQSYIETGKLQSRTGTLLQNRTKGAGHGSTSRAFYLRPEFMKQCLELSL